MERLRLRVILDDPDASPAPGEMVQGRVEATTTEPLELRGISVGARWEVSGRGNPHSATPTVPDLDLGPATCAPGTPLERRFSLAVPFGPPTYAGHNLSVDWFVEAAAHPGPVARAPFRVGPARPTEGGIAEVSDGGGLELGCALVCAFVLGICVIGTVVSGRFNAAVVLFGALALIGALIMVPKAVSHRRTGRVRLEAGPRSVGPGEEMAVRLTAVPRKTFRPRRVTAELYGEETVESGTGKGKKTLKVELARVRTVLEGPSLMEEGREGVWAGVLAVPRDAAPSLEAGPHRVTWKVRAMVELPLLPDPQWSVEVTVA